MTPLHDFALLSLRLSSAKASTTLVHQNLVATRRYFLEHLLTPPNPLLSGDGLWRSTYLQ
jgi:hypothetical protein